MTESNLNTGKLKFFDSEKIDDVLQKTSRVYLTGHLETPQKLLEHFDDIKSEMGISQYDDYTPELPHMHTLNTEFNFVINGPVKVLLVETGEEHTIQAGGMFIIEQNMPYCTKVKAGSRVVFFKTPGGNDKQLVPISKATARWMDSWDAVWEDE